MTDSADITSWIITLSLVLIFQSNDKFTAWLGYEDIKPHESNIVVTYSWSLILHTVY